MRLKVDSIPVRRLFTACVGLLVLSTSNHARASERDADDVVMVLALSALDATAILGGLVTSTGNAAVASSGERSGKHWPVAGYIAAAANVVGGGAFLTLAITNEDTDLLPISLSQLAVAGLGFASAAWCMSQPVVTEKPAVVFTPYILPGAGDGWAGGISAVLTGF